jgi:Septation protein etd1
VRPSSKKRKAGDLADFDERHDGSSSPTSRPGTSSTMSIPERKVPQRTLSSSNPPQTHRTRPSTAKVDASNNSDGRRHSIVKHGEVQSPVEHSEGVARRDSVSSRGSWIRRLSTIPNSYNISPRSSVGPDSPSLTFSHGSAAPILSDPVSTPAQLPPNKLVKRATSRRGDNGPLTRSGSKSQTPTLRRPATSHQRSVTLQQQFRDDSKKDSVLQTPASQPRTTPSSKFGTPERISWRPFFESRPTKLTKERLSGKSSDGSVQNFQSTSKRVIPDETTRPTLVKPAVINIMKSNGTAYYDEDGLRFDDNAVEDLVNGDADILPLTELPQESQRRARRSLSMNFSSPTSWISRSGSLRGNKRNTEGRGGGKRYSSAPVSTMPGRSIVTAHGAGSNKPRPIMDPTVFQKQPLSPADVSSPNDPFTSSFQARTRNTSSPLPPLSRLSSFNVDLARLGLSSSSSSAPRRSPTSPSLQPNTTDTSVPSTGHVSPNPSNLASHTSKPSRKSQVTDHTFVGSDNDGKGFTSGDDEDLDFQSETVFDSLRSGATGSIRSRNTPLDSMFDESPPSVNGNAKNKRLSIHEMLGNSGFSEGHNRIIEEDEGMSTPVKGPRFSQEEGFETPGRPGTMESDRFPSSPLSFSLATKDFGRLSLDDEEDDEDWTRDDENMAISNQLSPPSSSVNSRRVNSSFRAVLADVTHNASTNGNSAPSTERPERPKSNLFDWSEPSSAEKLDYMGNSPRPKTAHAKQIADGRGGRAIGRRGPTALHIRSQSVPVVPDIASQREHSKLTPKFGTWGLGTKGVSEDWDNDFEFGGTSFDNADERDINMESSGMLVPKAIQASQANVVGHVGQIREVCLLVEDLKRLRLLAKEKGLLEESSAPLWKEAEGIIALAVPDEEDLTLSPLHSPSSIIFDREPADDDDEDDGPDMGELVRPEAPFELLNRHGRPTGFVYDSGTVRRRSVFSPDDDIFGAGLNSPPSRDHLRPPPISPRPSSIRSASDVARSVMETMHQHRATSDPLLKEMAAQSSNKMPFDTTSLRDLVHRASVLSRTLADLIRKSDGRSPSPEAAPRCESSPAFTRVFTDPMASPPKNLPRSQSNNSILSGSIDTSPTRSLGQRMHMMTVV